MSTQYYINQVRPASKGRDAQGQLIADDQHDWCQVFMRNGSQFQGGAQDGGQPINMGWRTFKKGTAPLNTVIGGEELNGQVVAGIVLLTNRPPDPKTGLPWRTYRFLFKHELAATQNRQKEYIAAAKAAGYVPQDANSGGTQNEGVTTETNPATLAAQVNPAPTQ